MFQKLFLATFFLGSCSLFAQTPVIQSALNAADYSPMVAPGVWVAIFGTNLAPSTVIDTTLPLPSQLGGVTVTLTGGANVTENAPLRYVSATQINALIPFDLQPASYSLAVSTPSGVGSFPVILSIAAPAIYTQNAEGTGPALAFDANFQPVTQVSNSPIVLYAGGLGPTNPQTNTAAGGSSTEPLNRTVYTPQILIGGAPAQVAFSGVAPGLPGVYQLNVTPSTTTPAADNTLAVTFTFVTSGFTGTSISRISGAVTTLPVTTGKNTANATGGIIPTYPLSTTVLPYSPLLAAAKFGVAFDILPSAQPFNVVASCPGGNMTIALNPAAGTWQATANLPTSAMRSGDFSALTNSNGSAEKIFDFLNNDMQFPNNQIPQSRIDPVATQAMAAIALPNYTGTIANTNFLLQGAIPAGGHFVLNDSVNSNLENFGGFTYVNPPDTSQLYARTNACSVTVDGTLVGSSMVTFQ